VKEYDFLITKFVIKVLDLKNRKNDLSLDRTNWKFGKKHINLLVLGVNIKGVAVPLTWISLGKAGNSKTAARIKILSKIIHEIEVKSLTADREFIGEKWFKFLINLNIPFYIRIKKGTQVLNKNGKYTVSLEDLFKSLKPNRKKVLKGQYRVLGVDVNLAASRNSIGKLLIVMTNRCPYKALKIYKKRWSIEIFFGFLKTKGFNFEDTHMTNLSKISAWMLLLTIAVTWTMKTSLALKEKVSVGTHGRPRKSVFRSGFERLKKCLLYPLGNNLKELLGYMRLLKRQNRALDMV